MRARWMLTIAVLVSGCASGAPSPGAGTPAAAEPACPCRRDTHEQLQGTLWMQTAAEYQMLARTIYRAAGEAVAAALADPAWTAATEQASDPSGLPPAVILDLDETVLDNSRFQGEQVLRRQPYERPLWTAWVEKEEAGLVPGAAELLASLRRQGIAVFFVTNRTLAEEPFTLRNLQKLGIQAAAEEIRALVKS